MVWIGFIAYMYIDSHMIIIEMIVCALIGMPKMTNDATVVISSSSAEAKFFRIAFRCFKNMEVVMPIATMFKMTNMTGT